MFEEILERMMSTAGKASYEMNGRYTKSIIWFRLGSLELTRRLKSVKTIIHRIVTYSLEQYEHKSTTSSRNSERNHYKKITTAPTISSI